MTFLNEKNKILQVVQKSTLWCEAYLFNFHQGKFESAQKNTEPIYGLGLLE